MTETVIFTKTASSGKQIEVRAQMDGSGATSVHLYVEGAYLRGPSSPSKLKTAKGAVTHFLGGGFQGDQPAVGLTTEEADTITAACRALTAAWQTTAEGQAYERRLERERLVAKREGCLREANAAYERHHAAQETDAAWSAKMQWEAKAESIRQQIVAFDQETP